MTARAATWLALLTLGCSTNQLLTQGREDSWKACKERAVAGRKILCDGAALAEVQCREAFQDACKAIVVKYQDGAEVVVYQASGFDLRGSDTQPILGKAGWFTWAVHPGLAPDGSAIWFRNQGVTGSQWQEYDVFTGRLRDVDATDVWEQIQFKYGSRVVPLWMDGTPSTPPPR